MKSAASELGSFCILLDCTEVDFEEEIVQPESVCFYWQQ